jgi:aminomethyltransferase
MKMKNTPLSEKHIALRAKMAEFAGYNMPISYAGIREEHHAVRTNAGVFDVTHMGEFIVRGQDALALVQKVTSNDASQLAPGEVQYSCLPNENGGIVDDLLVYRLPQEMNKDGEEAFMLVVNASNIQKDWDWISRHNHFKDVRLIDISEDSGLLAVQGPTAAKILQPLTDLDLLGMKYYTFAKGRFAGMDNVLVSATGYTGAGGFEIYIDNKNLVKLWDAIFDAGKKHNIMPCGLGARDTLRLEMGYCLYGNDIDDTTSPIEAGLSWITKTTKSDFTSRETFVRQKAEGVNRRLVGFEVLDRRVPRHGYQIEDADGQEIGVVTSGTQSPSLDIPIGMGYVPVSFAKVGTEIFIVAGSKRLSAKVVKLPFYKGEL